MIIDIDLLKIDENNVLYTLKCSADSPAYERVKSEINRILELSPFKPAAYAEYGKYNGSNALFVLITAGREISEYSSQLMSAGECLGGLVADTIGDELLFAADTLVTNVLREELAKKRLGVKERYEDLNAAEAVIGNIREDSVRITNLKMLDPPKSMAYVLTLTDDISIFKAQHNCRECPNINCTRRSISIEEPIETVSDYKGYFAKGYGGDILCIDIGTTTIVFERVCNGTRKVYTAINRQRRFGADVISRIEASNAGRLKELMQLVLYQIAEGKSKLYGNKQPDTIIISANTTMVQLLLGCSCKNLGKYPFTAECMDFVKTDFNLLMGRGAGGASVTILPSISAFVGGDIVSGLYMCDFDTSERIRLFIDLGTNGEMAIGNRNSILVSSAAAGPAFEGGRISCGVGSVDGAVCGANEGVITTINNKPPVGICGTGIVELTAELLKNGIIDKTGLLSEKYFEKGYPVTDNIYFTQRDIREVQTAKSAVRAGIEILIKNYGCSIEDIESVYIAGGFGCRLNIAKACAIGLIPYKLKDKCIAIGNSSLGGAVKYGSCGDGDKRIEYIRSVSKELVLSLDGEFNEKYINYMNFGGNDEI